MKTFNFYDPNEGIEREESINNYKELFLEFSNNPPTIEESLLQLYQSSGITGDKANELIEEIKTKSKVRVNQKLSEIKEKYPSLDFDSAVIISSYTCEAEDYTLSPYIILNRNMVTKNRKEGLSKVSKYIFILLKALRLLPRAYPEKKILYRGIRVLVNLMIDPDDETVVPYITGKNKTFWTFTSTTPKTKKAYDFLGNNIIGNKVYKYGTLFTLTGKVWGYDITLFNKFDEEEYLLEPERKYYIENHYPEVNDLIQVFCEVKDTPLVLEDIIKTKDNPIDIKYCVDSGCYGGKPIRLTCKLGSRQVRAVSVYSKDPICVLMNKLNLTDKGLKFVFNGVTYSVNDHFQTFEEIGLDDNMRIFFVHQALAG